MAGLLNKTSAAVYDIRIEDPETEDCDIGNSVITPLNPLCGFIPRTITINPGDQLRFINNASPASHAPSSDPHPTHETYPALNLEVISPGGQAITAPLTQSGVWGCHSHQDAGYRCIITIRVPAGGGAAVIDKNPPKITNLKADVQKDKIVFTWDTDEPSSMQAEYGLTAEYGNFIPEFPNIMSQSHHEVELKNFWFKSLLTGKIYHFRARSFDSSNNLALSEDKTFVIPAPVVPAVPPPPKSKEEEEEEEAITTLKEVKSKLNYLIIKSGFEFKNKLVLGSQGRDVFYLQTLLAEFFGVYPEAQMTGYFGPLTEKALQRFQKKYGITGNGSPSSTGYGVLGPKTRAKINELIHPPKF
mgnify:CR=1 FL=1